MMMIMKMLMKQEVDTHTHTVCGRENPSGNRSQLSCLYVGPIQREQLRLLYYKKLLKKKKNVE